MLGSDQFFSTSNHCLPQDEAFRQEDPPPFTRRFGPSSFWFCVIDLPQMLNPAGRHECDDWPHNRRALAAFITPRRGGCHLQQSRVAINRRQYRLAF